MKNIFFSFLIALSITILSGVTQAQSAETRDTQTNVATENQYECQDSISDQIKLRQRKAIIGSWQMMFSSAALTIECPALGAFVDGGIYKGDQVGNVSMELVPIEEGTPIIKTDHYGSWTHVGDKHFAVTFISYLYRGNQDHSMVGMVKVRAFITLNDQGNEWSGQYTSEIQHPGGRVFYISNGTITGKRITTEPFF